MPDITQITVKTAGCEINTLRTGEPKGKDVLLLHGMSFQANTWRALGTLGVLGKAGFNVNAIDLPGFGLTKRCNMGPEAAVKGFIEAEGLNRPVLVGPSMGGRVSLNFALAEPEMVGGLVLIGCVGVDDNFDRLSTIRVPTLVVWGTKDHIAPFASAEKLHNKIQGSKLLVIEDARHPAYLDTPELWHRELLSFLRESFG